MHGVSAAAPQAPFVLNPALTAAAPVLGPIALADRAESAAEQGHQGKNTSS